MYKIERTGDGFKITFGGKVTKLELEQWLAESEIALRRFHRAFGVIVDMTNLEPLDAAAQAVMVRGQSLYRSKGMARSAVILNDPIVILQFRRLAKRSGIYAYERYFDASTDPYCYERARNWVNSGIDPDKSASQSTKVDSSGKQSPECPSIPAGRS